MTSVEIESYNYTDAHGALVFQSVRYDPKDFNQRRPDGRGGWIYDLDGVQKVLYRLQKVLAADTVYIVEGERDVHTVEGLELVGTCNAGGANSWDASYNEVFRGKNVVILPDQDVPGWKLGDTIARNLLPVAASVKLVNLPVGTKGDVTDWRYAGGTREALDALVEGSGAYVPSAVPEEPYTKSEPIPDAIYKGQGRHKHLVSVAGSMRYRGLNEEEILAALVAINSNRCKPPYDHQHLVKIAASMEKYPTDTVRAGSNENFALKPVCAAALLNMHFDPYQWAVDNLLPAVGVSILAGRPKKGKSWMALQLSIAVANGTKALGRFMTRQGRVLYLGSLLSGYKSNRIS
jgi:hypothetical protein